MKGEVQKSANKRSLDNVLVIILLDPVIVQNDGKLNSSGHVGDSSHQCEGHLHGFHNCKDDIKWEGAKDASEEDTRVEEKESHVRDG